MNDRTNTPDQKLSKKENTVQVIKFALFSVSAGIIQTLSFTLVNEVFKWAYTPCYLIALTLSVLWNFTLNRKFTFCSANNVPVAMAKVAGFYVVFAPLSTWWTGVLTGDSMGWNPYIVLILTMLVNFVTEYLFDRFIVFGKSIDTAQK